MTHNEDVFSATPVAYADPLTNTATLRSDEGLRTVAVEERVGVPRRKVLVRVPLFFARGECTDPNDVLLVGTEADEAPIAVQVDDVRRGPDGGVSRMHLWFTVDLGAFQRRTFRLVTRKHTATASVPNQAAQQENGLTVNTQRGRVFFDANGGLRRIQAGDQTWDFGTEASEPEVKVTYSDKGPAAVFGRGGHIRPEVRWAEGPLFTKLVVNWAGLDGARLEQTWRVPRSGQEIVLTSAVFLGSRPGGKLSENRLIVGSAPPEPLLEIPAGVRPDLRNVHAYAVNAWQHAGGALLAEPVVIGGSNGRWEETKEGRLGLDGFRGVARGKGEQDTLHAFWTEVRLIPLATTDAEALWSAHRDAVQPLVAVVEDPRARTAALHEALQQVVRGMKPVNWAQEASRFQMLGAVDKRDAVFRRHPDATEIDSARLVRSGEKAWAKLSEHGQRKLREDEKSRASGLLDPYHVTYTLSSAAALAQIPGTPAKIDDALNAIAEATREFLGRTGDEGFPYVDCYSRTLNMQMGPVLFGLAAKKGGPAALPRQAFYRDLATAPVVLGVFGRGQRPYVATRREKPDYSDYLYQAISDFWLRTAELLGHEDLQLHPLAFARYTDCVDVLADRYHAVDSRDRDGSAGPARANFFRGQGHTHRWLGWSCAPFVRLLETPGDSAHWGLTEAIYYARIRAGRWNNWPDLTFYALTDLLTSELSLDGRKPSLPPRPRTVAARVTPAGVEITWTAVTAAQSYRVLRAPAASDDWVWLNSPYVAEKPPAAATPTRWVDATGHAGSRYVVLSVDRDGRASAWPLDTRCAIKAIP